MHIVKSSYINGPLPPPTKPPKTAKCPWSVPPNPPNCKHRVFLMFSANRQNRQSRQNRQTELFYEELVNQEPPKPPKPPILAASPYGPLATTPSPIRGRGVARMPWQLPPQKATQPEIMFFYFWPDSVPSTNPPFTNPLVSNDR